MINQNIKKAIATSYVVLQLFYSTLVGGAVENPARNTNNQTSSKNNIQELKTVNNPVKNGEEKNLENMIIDLELVENMAKNLPYNTLDTMDESVLYLNASRFAAYGFPLEAVICGKRLEDPKDRYEIGTLLLNQGQVGNAMKLYNTLLKDSMERLLAMCSLYHENPNNALKIEEGISKDYKNYFDESLGLDDIKLESVPYWIKKGNVDVAKRVSRSIRNEFTRVNAAEEFYKLEHPKSAEQILWTIQGEEANKAATKLYYKYKNQTN